MNRFNQLCLATCATLLAAHPMLAANNNNITYQGELKKNNKKFTGQADMIFRLFDSASGGAQFGSDFPIDDVDVKKGRFTVLLDFGANIFTGDVLWLEIEVNNIILNPRQLITPAPYAHYALGPWLTNGTALHYDSGNVGIGKSNPGSPLDVNGKVRMNDDLFFFGETEFEIAHSTNTGMRIDPQQLVLTLEVDNNDVFTALDSGHVGIGTTDPATTFHVRSANTVASMVDNSNSSLSAVGVQSTASIAFRGFGSAIGVEGRSTNPGSAGLWGTSSGDQGIGVFGEANDADSTTIGVWGQASSPTGRSIVATHPGGGTALYAASNATGFFGFTTSIVNTGASGIAMNLYSDSSNPTLQVRNDGAGDIAHLINQNSIVAMRFKNNGDLSVIGNLSKAGGSFKIDHPLDPTNKYLYHSFVESPDMLNIYNGNIRTDGNGVAVVELPEWFEALNKDFRYQLTVIGSFAQAMVAEEVHKNAFVIQTSEPNTKVSWQVTGVRHDPYANANRIPVEQDKAPQDRGRYLHPQAYGKSIDTAVGQTPRIDIQPLPKVSQ